MVPNGWETLSASDSCNSVSVGVVIKPSQYYVDSNIGIKAFRSANVREGFINDTDWVYFSPEGHKANKKSQLREGDVLIVRSGYPGTACVVTKEFEGSNAIDIVIARTNDEIIIPEYLCTFINSSLGKDQILNLQGGLAQKHFNVGAFKHLYVNIPPLPEQRKIAQILSTWDRGIATTEKLIDASKQQKKALMQQLLTGKKRLVDPETGKAFEGDWEEVKVAEFGKVVTGNTPPKNDDSNYGSDISWATAEDFKSKYVGNTKVKLTKVGASKARIVPKGSVLVTCIASIGKNAITDENITTNQQINAVVINNNHCNEFFYYQIEFNKHKLLAWAGTTAVPILNKSSFEKIPLSAPSKNEQQKIASVLTATDKEIELLQAKLAHFKQEKKALMQQLLTGKRRVSLSS
jgi:type I restriction enzyme S subunit